MLGALFYLRKFGEWVRDVLCKPVFAERTAAAHPATLGELLAVRKILLSLQSSVAVGEPVTRDRMLALIEEADAEKASGRGSRPAPSNRGDFHHGQHRLGHTSDEPRVYLWCA